MRQQHTQGPWKSHSASLSDNTLVVTAKHPTEDGFERICVVRDGDSRSYSDEDDRAQANARLIESSPDAERILRHLLEYVEAGEPTIHFDGLMPDDGYDGATDEQTLADAVRAYFAKAERR